MFHTSILAILNHLLAQEPWAQQRVRTQVGKVVAFKAAGLQWLVQFTEVGTLLRAASDATVDATLTVAPELLPHILQHGMLAAGQKVHITGDAELVAVLGDLLQHVRWDAEQDLSRVLGDIAAHRLMQAARQSAKTSQQAAQYLTANLVEYFTEENPMLVTPPQLTVHRAALQELRDQIARLEKRMQKLQ